MDVGFPGMARLAIISGPPPGGILFSCCLCVFVASQYMNSLTILSYLTWVIDGGEDGRARYVRTFD